MRGAFRLPPASTPRLDPASTSGRPPVDLASICPAGQARSSKLHELRAKLPGGKQSSTGGAPQKYAPLDEEAGLGGGAAEAEGEGGGGRSGCCASNKYTDNRMMRLLGREGRVVVARGGPAPVRLARSGRRRRQHARRRAAIEPPCAGRDGPAGGRRALEERGRALEPGAGRRFTEGILRKGGAVAPETLVRDLLGHDALLDVAGGIAPDNRAALRELEEKY